MFDEFQIICGACGKSNPIMNWIERPSGYKLPGNCFQCPACGKAIKRALHTPKLEEDAHIPEWSGSYITLEEIQPYP